MQWIAPTEKDTATDTLEKRLWSAANQLWAGAGLKQSDYSEPILGLIFLRFAEVRFSARRAALLPSPSGRGTEGEGAVTSSRRGNRAEDPTAYHSEGVLFLASGARFAELLQLPEGTDIGKALNEAMKVIERDNPQMAGVLPKGYQVFDSRLLSNLLKTLSTIPADLEGDAFGKIYEYFLGTFAMSEGQKGGEFFTPTSIVRFLVEVLEPFHGRILDPACGSGGMFVQSARFVKAHQSARTPSSPALLPGGEGSGTGHYRGGFDFAGMKERARELRQQQTPAEDALWQMLRDRQLLDLKFRRQHQFGDYILDFYCAEKKLAVELDGKPHTTEARKKVDAKRDAYLKSQGVTVLRFENHLVFDDTEQILTAIANHILPLPLGEGRGEGAGDYSGDPARELSLHGQERVDGNVRLARMNLAVHGLEGDIKHGNSYYEDLHSTVGKFDFVCANPPFNVSQVDKERLSAEVGPGRRYPFGLPRTDNANYLWIQDFYSALNDTGRAGFVMANSASDARVSEQDIRQKLIQAHAVDVMVAVGTNMFYTVALPCTLWFFDKGKAKTPRADTVLFIDARHIYRQIDRAHRDWTDAQISFMANIVRLYRGEAPDFTLGGEEAQAKLSELFGEAASPNHQSKIVNHKYRDIPGLCKAATLAEIEAQGWSLNPGRYVGVAPGETVSDEDFKTQLGTWNEELETLNAQARDLEQTIAQNVAEILEA